MLGLCKVVPLKNYDRQQICFKEVYWGKGEEWGPGERVEAGNGTFSKPTDGSRTLRAEKRKAQRRREQGH